MAASYFDLKKSVSRYQGAAGDYRGEN